MSLDTIEIHGVQQIFSSDSGEKNALDTIFNYYGKTDTKLDGDIFAVVKKNGFVIEELPQGFEPIKQSITFGTPVLVKVRDSDKKIIYGIVLGADKERVKFLNSKSGRMDWMNWGDFDTMWMKEAATIQPGNKEYKKSHDYTKTMVSEEKMKGHI